MTNKSKAKGTRAESRVRNYLRDLGFTVERHVLKGSKDEGDLHLTMNNGDLLTIEVKAGQQTKAPSRRQIKEWQRQTLIERENADANMCCLIVVRFGRILADADVYVPVYDWSNDCHLYWMHLYLDELSDFINSIKVAYK